MVSLDNWALNSKKFNIETNQFGTLFLTDASKSFISIAIHNERKRGENPCGDSQEKNSQKKFRLNGFFCPPVIMFCVSLKH